MRKAISRLLVACMLLSLLSVTAFAAPTVTVSSGTLYADASGSTYTLTADTTASFSVYSATADALTINLNTHNLTPTDTITNTYVVVKGPGTVATGSVTLSNGGAFIVAKGTQDVTSNSIASVSNGHKVTLDAGGGQFSYLGTYVLEPDVFIYTGNKLRNPDSLLTPTLTGKTFVGWFSDATAGDYYGGTTAESAYTIGADVTTLYAHWTTNSDTSTGGGGGAAAPAQTTTTTTTNADGSTTTTVTAADGSKTETTTKTDGSKGEVKTNASGVVTSAEATVSTAAVTAAVANNEAVTLPIEVPAAASSATAAAVKIDVPATVTSSNPIDVEIPVTNVKATTVVVLVKADGTEEIIKDAALTEDGLVIGVTGDVTVKVIDNAKTFRDSATVSSWAKDSVGFVTSREIFNGTDTGFEPKTPMNRGMFAQVLYNLEGKPAASNGAFADASGKWYDAAASWASANGVVNGDNGNFNGDASITRQDLVTMLYRYAQAKGYDTTAPSTSALGGFNDTASVAGYAKTAMEWAVANGIMGGMDGGINPTGSATREMVAAFAERFCNNVIH